MSSKIPEIIYKYVDSKTLIQILKNLSIRCNSPENFNDIYDCEPIFEVPEEFKKMDNGIYQNKYDNGVEGSVKCTMDRSRNEFRITCFSEEFDNFLMWSHYADKHKGCVLALKPSTFLLKHINKVSYKNEPVILRDDAINLMQLNPSKEIHIDKAIKNWNELYTTKSEFWAYEKEWRLVLSLKGLEYEYNSEIQTNHSDKSGKLKKNLEDKMLINKGFLDIPIDFDDFVAIYFGAKISKRVQTRILNILKEKGITVPVFKAEKLYNSYELKFIPLGT